MSDDSINQAQRLHDLGTSLAKQGRRPEAIDAFRQALAIKPNSVDTLNNLGYVLIESTQIDEAIATFRKAIAINPNLFNLQLNLANALYAADQIDEAIVSLGRAIQLNPKSHLAHQTLGNCFKAKGVLKEAIVSYQQVLSLSPDYPQALNNLAATMLETGDSDAALSIAQKTISLYPNYAEAFNTLANILKSHDALDQAVANYRQAMSLKPNFTDAHLSLGNALLEKGQLDEALMHFRQAADLRPAAAAFKSALLYAMHYHPDYDAQSILEAHRAWDQRVAQSLREKLTAPKLDPLTNRRIRIGYVSSDFYNHAVGRHILPLLANHDRTKFEIFVYADVRKPDSLTDRHRSHADHWETTLGQSNADLAKKIRDDNIDILVDLNLHTAGTRLLAFARKPAPIQITWLGYCSTTGLAAMDYRISDSFMDPPMSKSNYVEQTIRLPKTFWCYQPGGPASDISPLPAADAGYVTFACLNNFAKVSPPALELWTRLLAGIPDSRLIIQTAAGSHRDELLKRFGTAGVSADRIQFFSRSPWETYVDLHKQIDIAMDPFPYGGGITTCDALYMGVPVITLTGQTAVGRGGTSILSNLNLHELIAKNPDEYLQIATKLASDLPRLKDLRQSLRTRMQNSPLMDAPAFARDFEAIYTDLTMKYESR